MTDSSESTTPAGQNLRPEWDAVRETTAAITHHGRLYLRGQVRLGMLLAGLKKAHGIEHGGDRKSSGGIRHLIPWPEIMLQETGFARRQGYEFIRLYESVLEKFKRTKLLAELPATGGDALALFQPENAHALSAAEWESVDTLIGTLTNGETQASLLTELGVIAKPRAMPNSNKSPDSEPSEEITAGQLAFHFFEAIASPLINARLSPDYLKLLHALPLHSTAEHPLSLATLEAEARAMLADIERVKQAAARPAKGRVIAMS